MDMKLQAEKQEYEELVSKYREVEKIVAGRLEEGLKEASIKVMQLPHRIKTWDSVTGKLLKKHDKYSKVSELTDILGFRVICYFSAQVDEAAEVIQKIFNVDVARSCDKRVIISPTTFGYLSLHNICSLKKDDGYPEELTKLKFEIQLRTILQHAWAEIEHDLGYKTPLEIPRKVRREFSRVAGLLEVADDSFDHIRTELDQYERETIHRIETDTAASMTLDIHTLNIFMKRSSAVLSLYSDMEVLTSGEVIIVRAEGYLPLLSCLKIETLEDLYELIRSEHDHVLVLLSHALDYSDLEEITSNAALFYLCRAKLIWGDYSRKEINDIYRTLTGDNDKAERITNVIIGMRNKLME